MNSPNYPDLVEERFGNDIPLNWQKSVGATMMTD